MSLSENMQELHKAMVASGGDVEAAKAFVEARGSEFAADPGVSTYA